jgi:BirA family biotin operon repressor/biotin-[acetyl-CoA-carboxylase] ligase
VNTRDHVLKALRDAGAAGVSGETVAGALGISRVAVGKHVAALRGLGYVVEAVPGTGYLFVSAPDLALPGEVSPLVLDPLWRRFEGGAQTGSTNDDARALALQGAEEGTVVVAASQSAGRGRMGRVWESHQGGAYFSAVLRPPVAPSQAGPLALVVALGVARGLETLGVHPRLKWPNDLLLGSGKLAGVLLEMSAEGDCVEWVVAGVGINISQPDGRLDSAAYVCDAVTGVGPAQVTAAALDGLAVAYRQWLEGDFEPLRTAWEERSAMTGRDVVVSDMSGAVRAAGRVEGVDAEGRLLLSGPSGVEAVVAGEVTLRR